MAIKSEIYPIMLKISPSSTLGIDPSMIKIDLENSEINVYNDRGGILTIDGEQKKLFKDDGNLLIGYQWDTSEDRFNIQDHYTFEFLVAINYVTETIDTPTGGLSDAEHTRQLKLFYSTTKILESNNRI